MTALIETAPAKVNLTLRVLGRREDGKHDLASLVAFAGIGDRVSLRPGPLLELSVDGPTAASAGPNADNLVLLAANALSARIEGLKGGRFALGKHLPVGAGLGGGSSDAAAALRLLARHNNLAPDDSRLMDAAQATGADVPVCLDPRARLMHGTGDILSGPLKIPALDAVIVFPGIPLSTASVFRAFDPAHGEGRAERYDATTVPTDRESLIEFLLDEPNDLERPARSLVPAIAAAQETLDSTAPILIRMSGSGSAVFAIYEDAGEAARAAEDVRGERRDWWVAATTLR